MENCGSTGMQPTECAHLLLRDRSGTGNFSPACPRVLGAAPTPDGNRRVAAQPCHLVRHLLPGLQRRAVHTAGGVYRLSCSLLMHGRRGACADGQLALAASAEPNSQCGEKLENNYRIRLKKKSNKMCHLSKEGSVSRVHATRKHRLLPHQHPGFIAGVVKRFCTRWGPEISQRQWHSECRRSLQLHLGSSRW